MGEGVPGVSWSCLSGARKGLQTGKKTKPGAKGSSNVRTDCTCIASVQFRT